MSKYKIIRLNESMTSGLTLYRAVDTLKKRYDLVYNREPFVLNESMEVDFASTLDICLGYARYALKITVFGMNFKDCTGTDFEDRDQVISEGYDGIKHYEQYYVFNVEKLNRSIQSIQAVCNSNSKEKPLYLSTSQVKSTNQLSKQTYILSKYFEPNIDSDSVVLCEYNEKSDNLLRQVEDPTKYIEFSDSLQIFSSSKTDYHFSILELRQCLDKITDSKLGSAQLQCILSLLNLNSFNKKDIEVAYMFKTISEQVKITKLFNDLIKN